MKHNSARTTLCLAGVAAVLWCAFGLSALARHPDDPSHTAPSTDQTPFEMLADVRKTLNDQQLELRMPSAMAPILQTLHGKQGDLTVRNENSRLRSLGSAVNSDLESVAARIGRLNQSYRIPALRINGNGVQGTSHSDQEDEGTTLRMDSKRSTGGVFGESPSEIRQLRQELRQLSDEVARLKSLIQKTDL